MVLPKNRNWIISRSYVRGSVQVWKSLKPSYTVLPYLGWCDHSQINVPRISNIQNIFKSCCLHLISKVKGFAVLGSSKCWFECVSRQTSIPFHRWKLGQIQLIWRYQGEIFHFYPSSLQNENSWLSSWKPLVSSLFQSCEVKKAGDYSSSHYAKKVFEPGLCAKINVKIPPSSAEYYVFY